LTGLIYVVVLFPIIVFLGAASNPPSRIARLCKEMGELSYPIYILQGPFLRIGEEILKRRPFASLHSMVFAIIEAVVVLFVS
jgi:peptidoglycan/LPS O-acetylase OafA/YrhL